MYTFPMKTKYLLPLLIILLLTSCQSMQQTEAELIYSRHEGTLEKKDDIQYVFRTMEGEEVSFLMETDEDFTLQNKLKAGVKYSATIDNDTIVSLEEEKGEESSFTPLIQGTPGVRSVKNLISTAFTPVGSTLYVYGGGWNWQDDGSGDEVRTIGLSPEWEYFFSSQDSSYSFRDERYYPKNGINQMHDKGLDCSGFVGWTLYNVFNTENGNPGFVTSSKKMARKLGDMGLGEWESVYEIDSIKCGDIISIDGHVWIAIGTCSDGSVIAIHSTASESREGKEGGGPELSAVASSTDSEAYRIADYYMSTYYPEWYKRYPVALKSPDVYFYTDGENMGKLTWSKSLEDKEGYREMSAEEVLKDIFSNL